MTDIGLNPAATQPDDLGLSAVLPDFASRGWHLPAAVTYPAVWRAVVNGRLPAQMVNGRYRVLRRDLPVYAAFLKLTPPMPAKPSHQAVAAPAAAAA